MIGRVVHYLQGRSVACGTRAAHLTATMSIDRVTCAECLRVQREAQKLLERMEASR